DRPGWPFAFVTIPDDVSVVERRGFGAATLWIRRPRSEAGKGLSGVVRTMATFPAPGMKVPFSFTADDPGKQALTSDRKILTRWANALSMHLREEAMTAWRKFAQSRIDEAYGEKKGIQPAQIGRAHV